MLGHTYLKAKKLYYGMNTLSNCHGHYCILIVLNNMRKYYSLICMM